jgi:hypothetical protein
MESPEILNIEIPPAVSLVASNSLRDPHGCKVRYNQRFEIMYSDLSDGYFSRISDQLEKRRLGHEHRLLGVVSGNLGGIVERFLYMYARGDSIADILSCFKSNLEYSNFLRNIYINCDSCDDFHGQSDRAIYSFYSWGRLPFFSFVLLLISDISLAKNWLTLFRGNETQRKTHPENYSYYLDLLVRAFLPDWPVQKNKYTAPNRGRPGERLELVRALFLGLSRATTAGREQAMGDYVDRWNRMMRPYGWKQHRAYAPLNERGIQIDQRVKGDELFTEFAFEAALAVCAYDLDDSSFRDHPYYPRDLVDHYRAHVRNTRDAWRAVGVGPDIEIEAPPLPPKLDLAKSKSKGLERWLELVSDGDADAVAAVLEQVGKLRKVKDSFALSCALGENNAGLCADIKDDNTLAAQIERLIDKRGLTGWNPSGLPAAGPDRCSGLLLALDRYLSDKPYVLRALGGEDDSWQGVVVPRAFEGEFAQVSDSLTIRTANPHQPYDL